jgi:hypothetical protein
MAVVKRLGLKLDEFLAIDIEDNFIKLIPVHMEPKYTLEELKTIDHIVEKEKSKARSIKPGKEFSQYIQKLVT